MLPPRFLASSGLFLVLPQRLPALVTTFSCDFVVASAFNGRITSDKSRLGQFFRAFLDTSRKRTNARLRERG
jgi:hypothetical protein